MASAGDDARWCPWCASVLPVTDFEQRCVSCNGKVPADAALMVQPGAPLHPNDPEAHAPARGPEGSAPLPVGTPDPTLGGMAVWAGSIVAAIVALSAAAYFFGGPALDRVPPPTATVAPTATVTATPVPVASPAR